MKVALIPARAGSRRCPNKNTEEISGVPLIEWAIRTAKASECFDEIVVSTNDQKAYLIASDCGVGVISRPEFLAQPETAMLPVVRHALNFLENCTHLMLLQPTSPFRTKYDIRNAFKLLADNNATSVISVTEAPPDMAFEVGHSGRLRPCPAVVVPNGAIYLSMTENLLAGESWYDGFAYAYQMPKDRSLDIDTPLDLEIARMMAGNDGARPWM